MKYEPTIEQIRRRHGYHGHTEAAWNQGYKDGHAQKPHACPENYKDCLGAYCAGYDCGWVDRGMRGGA